MSYEYSGTVVNKVKMYSHENFHDALIDRFGDSFREYRTNWDRAGAAGYLPEFPLFLDVEPEYRCNLKCTSCVFSIPEDENPYLNDDQMDLETFGQICEEGARYGLPAITVSNNNEGLMDKYVFDRIEIARSNGIMDIFVGTNGLLLKPTVADRLIDSGLTRLLVSIDAASPETYLKTRMNKGYDRVIENCQVFLDKRNARGLRLPLLRVSMVKTSANEHEVEDFREFWSDKADIISIQDYIPTKPTHAENVALTPSDREPYPEDVIPRKSEKFCGSLWQRFTIRANGDIYACCHMKYELKVGNLSEMSLHEAWHSEFMNGLRDIHQSGMYQCMKLCSKCL